MLKTRLAGETWLVHQPDHARVSGYLAAHWGNPETQFAAPGSFAPAPAAEVYRAQVVQAIAEHDNGWWEWEAFPEFDSADGWPLHLPDVGRTSADAGLQRWRLGIPRLRERAPYAALLVSQHAYWLYAFAFEDWPELNGALRHPIFGQPGQANRLVTAPELTRSFLNEQAELQAALVRQLRRDDLLAAAAEPQHLLPHVRLLQVLDTLSLLLSFGGTQELRLADVPRGAWDDRVEMTWRPVGKQRIACSPYPFAVDPLEVFLPVRVIADDSAGRERGSLVELHAVPLKTVRFEVASR